METGWFVRYMTASLQSVGYSAMFCKGDRYDIPQQFYCQHLILNSCVVSVASIIINVQLLRMSLRWDSGLRSSGVWRCGTGYWCPAVRKSVVPSTSEVCLRPRTKYIDLCWWMYDVSRNTWDQLPIEVIWYTRKTGPLSVMTTPPPGVEYFTLYW
jgi:hypothetical protein